jgi:hypothetical protein
MADVQTSDMGAKLATVACDYQILYSDRSSKNKRLLMGSHLREITDLNLAGG